MIESHFYPVNGSSVRFRGQQPAFGDLYDFEVSVDNNGDLKITGPHGDRMRVVDEGTGFALIRIAEVW